MFILKIYLINLLFTNIIFFEHNIMFIDKILFKFVKGVTPSLFHDDHNRGEDGSGRHVFHAQWPQSAGSPKL